MPFFASASDETTDMPPSASEAANTPRRRGRPRKDAGEGTPARMPLSAREANDLKDQLVDLLATGFEDTDKLISVTSADKAPALIWSTIDDREIEILADAWIQWGKSSAQGAAVVRLVVSQWKRYQVAIILGPRFLETINFYAEHGAALPLPASRKRTRAQAQTSTRAQAQASAQAQAQAEPVDANKAAEQAQAAHMAQLAARRNLIASGGEVSSDVA